MVGNALNVKREDIHRHRVALLTESVTHRERVLEVTDLPQAFYRWKSSLKEFFNAVEGRRHETHDAKGNPGCCGFAAAIPHLQRDSELHVANRRGSEQMFTWMRCAIRQKKVGTFTPRVSTNTNTPTATKTTTPVPMDASQISSNVSKLQTVEQESDSYQYEQDQECDGDEVFAVKGKGKGSKEPVSKGE